MTMYHGSSFARSAHPSIKPIETLWKGYRFRSRLEARWAVFFETLGLNWEYEPQGFELPDGSRYLPDFYLPDQETYVEIKPSINRQFEKVYLAGKFSTDWRDTICQGYHHSGWCGYSNDRNFNEIVGPFRATPFGNHFDVIPCTHSLTGSEGESDNEYFADDILNPEAIFQLCMDAISRCTVFFAWIDSLDCYGTLAEIGYAKALGKKIYIGIDENLEIPQAGIADYDKPHNIDYQDDLWFVKRMADKTVVTKDVFDAYVQTIGHHQPNELKKIRQVPGWMLIAGNPHPGEYKAFQEHEAGYLVYSDRRGFRRRNSPKQKELRVSLFLFSKESDEILNALAVARAARFEHGEKP